MNYNFRRLTMTVGLILTTQLFFVSAQKKLDLKFEQKISLKDYPYFGINEKIQVLDSSIFFVIDTRDTIKLYKQKVNDTFATIVQTVMDTRDVWLTDFKVDPNLEYVYYLFNKGIVRKKLNKKVDFNENEFFVENEDVYYELNVYDDRIIQTSCYNRYTESKENPPCLLEIYDALGQKRYDQKYKHDAIALTHFPSYFFDVNESYVAFVQSLKNNVQLLNIQTFEIENLGDSSLLNRGIDSIPFSTVIGPQSNSAKKVMGEVREFASTLETIEGTLIVNADTVLVIRKKKGKNINKKRIIDLYTKEIGGDWKLSKQYRFKNGLFANDYHLFAFYLSTPPEFLKDGRVYISEMDVPNSVNSKLDLWRYSNKASNFSNPTNAIYIYTISFD